MPTVPSKTSYTPDRAAAVFARQFPRFAGVLDVRSTTPAGKHGRYLKDKTTRFYCALGAIRKTLTRKLRLSANAVRSETYRNGLCPVCGRLSLSPLIGWAFDSTGLSVEACPPCLGKHGLRPNSARYLTAAASPLAMHDIGQVDVVIDIRAVQAGYEVDWIITWKNGAAGEPVRLGSPAPQVSNALVIS